MEIIHDNSKIIYSSAKNYNFLRGKIINFNGNKYIYILNALKSNDKRGRIEKIELNGMISKTIGN